MRALAGILLFGLAFAGTATAQDQFITAAQVDSAWRPGLLLSSDSMTRRTLPKGARAWRIVYTTTLSDRIRDTATALVLAARTLPAGGRPVISWTHGTVGIAPQCSRSNASAPFIGVPALDQILARGWVLVATDYGGLPTTGTQPYLLGEAAARSALDAVRAARQIPGLVFDARTIVWGHSQGGHTALWEGIIAPKYAPDVDVIGVAADSPVSDPMEVIAMHGSDSIAAILGSYIAVTYSEYYSDVRFVDAVQPHAYWVARKLANLCGSVEDMPELQRYLKLLAKAPVLTNPKSGALSVRLSENEPRGRIRAPLLIAHGLADSTIDPRIQERFIHERCAAGQLLEYWTFPGQTHASIVEPSSPLGPELVRWTEARLAKRPQAASCQLIASRPPKR